MRKALVLPLAVLVAGALAACGSSSSTSTAASSQPSASAAPASSSSSAAATTAAKPVIIATKHSKLGTVLAVGPNHLTVYLFEADKGTRSACSGSCATAWPPVTGKPQAAGAAVASDLSTITRSDGRTQVTYKGHPLYTFVKDKDDGDAYGQAIKAFGAEWYVLSPSGHKVDES